MIFSMNDLAVFLFTFAMLPLAYVLLHAMGRRWHLLQKRFRLRESTVEWLLAGSALMCGLALLVMPWIFGPIPLLDEFALLRINAGMVSLFASARSVLIAFAWIRAEKAGHSGSPS